MAANNLPLSQQEMMAITQRVMSDKTPLDIRINILELWVLISLLQLTTRHPDLPEQMKQFAIHHGRQFQKAIATAHPEANQVIEMGWNTRFDVDKSGSFVNPHEPLEVHNIFTLYSDEDDDNSDALLAFGSRPQDWGNPKWRYKKITASFSIDAQEYKQVCHFWFTEKWTDAEFMQQDYVKQMVGSPYLPGSDKELCGREYLAEDDFWSDDWGKMPPHFEPTDEYGEDY
jgi:hypothetical protein